MSTLGIVDGNVGRAYAVKIVNLGGTVDDVASTVEEIATACVGSRIFCLRTKGTKPTEVALLVHALHKRMTSAGRREHHVDILLDDEDGNGAVVAISNGMFVNERECGGRLQVQELTTAQ